LQRPFIVRLLGQSSFSKHLCAVKEINNLLMRSLGIREDDEGASIAVSPPAVQHVGHDSLQHITFKGQK
jgi:hypothetical protein